MVDVGGDVYEVNTLSYHENLNRKQLMLPVLTQLDRIMQELRDLEPDLKAPTPDEPEVMEWRQLPKHSQKLEGLCWELEEGDHELNAVFQDLGTMVLCNLEDRIKNLMAEIREKQRSTSVLSNWEELEIALVDDQEITTDDVQRHQNAVRSFVKVLLTVELENGDIDLPRHIRNGSIGGSASVSAFPLSPDRGQAHTTTVGSSAQGKTGSSVTESDKTPIDRPFGMLGLKPKRLSVLFVDLNNTSTSCTAIEAA